MLITMSKRGRVVLDMPSAYLDAFGRVLYTKHEI